jgi:GNAT superfamily N-acetyltransferase
MSAYRFCRTDDMALLVDALNRCWSPYHPGEPLMTMASFKRSIRDLQIWCSSCMVAFSGTDPIGVLIGGKRSSGTLIHRIAVHPEHRRLGHGRHLLASLGSKLAILGPPRIAAEIPETCADACALFRSSGYVQEARLTDYVLDASEERDEGKEDGKEGKMSGDRDGRFVIPVTVDDLAANGLLDDLHPQTCWERSVDTLMARKDDITGLALASDERIDAYVLHVDDEIVALRSVVADTGHLRPLLRRLRAQARQHSLQALRFSKVHPAEMSQECLSALGFRPADAYLVYTATARGD